MSVHRSDLPAMATMLVGLAALLLCLPAHGLYKVVGPDGKVTYTDRMPSPADGKVTPLNAAGNGVATDPAALPLELRQVALRYPVTLYVIADCAPCDGARALLRQRGIPHAERLVLTEEDVDALQRLTGTRDTPTLMIGQQPLRGLSVETWNAYLDSAGYPRESRLPASYQYATATPIVERRDAASAVPPPAAPAPTRPAEPAVANPSGIKF